MTKDKPIDGTPHPKPPGKPIPRPKPPKEPGK